MRRIPSELWFALFILGWSYYLRGLFLSMQFSEPPPPAIRVAAGIKVSSTGTTYEKLYDEASKLHYVLFKPPKFATQPGLVWPLLVFLHGAGEQGEDLDLLFSEGATGCPPAELAAGRANCVLKDHFVVLAPQTSQGWHYDVDKLGPLVDRLVADPSLGLSADHLYVTGVANGGFGAWALGATTLPGSKRHRFAAVAPVSSSKAIDIEHLGRVPVWAFHSANDVIVHVGVSDELVSALRRYRGENKTVRYTRYDLGPAPTGEPEYEGHASWKHAYDLPILFQWFLDQKRGPEVSSQSNPSWWL